MQNWINFWNLIFWLSMLCLINNIDNFIKMLFFSELIWVLLYNIILVEGSINDDLNILSFSIFILGFAGLEYSIGILIILLFKNINKKIEFDETDNDFYNHNIYSNKSIYINRFIWNYKN